MTPGSHVRFNELSYKSHDRHNRDDGGDQLEPDLSSVDAWRHDRMFATIQPLILANPTARWLTVGDGRYGSDARRLLRMGAGEVIASDITDTRLREAHAAGLLGEFRQENAEAMSLPDDAVDFVFCKEAYHHFPRPPVAFYEMMRVCRRGVVLIEPNDQFQTERLGDLAFTKLREAALRLLGRPSVRGEYETSGNYTFRTSARELEKMALGMNLPALAYTFLNDYYLPGAGSVRIGASSPIERKIRRMVRLHDLAARMHLKPWRVIAAVVFKDGPEPATASSLRGAGFTVVNLPRNPYL